MKQLQPNLSVQLRPGDKIGIAAPSSPFNGKAFNGGVAILKKMGYDIHIPGGLFDKQGYLAGADAHRADMLNTLFTDRTVKAIFCARGGFGALRTLSRLDYKTIRKNPKILIGFSDVTALLTTLYERCGLVTFHGPLVTQLRNITRRSREMMHRVISSDDRLEIVTRKDAIVIRPGSVDGPVIGGNLTTLCHLMGTPYQTDFKGHILFLEDTGETPYRIDRMLSQMKLAGCFNGLAGLALGSFINCGRMAEIRRIVADIFSDHKIPILSGFEIGHGRTNLTIPIGLSATLDTKQRSLRFYGVATRK